MIDFITKLVGVVFVYCTDFMINLANLLGWSYYEVNSLIFCLLWPLVTAVLLIAYAVQVYRLKKLQRK